MSRLRSVITRRLHAVCFLLGLAPCALSFAASERSFGSLTEILQAIDERTRQLAASEQALAAAVEARTAAQAAFAAKEEVMQAAVAAEVQRTPALRGTEFQLYARDLPPTVASDLVACRQRLAEAQNSLAQARRDNEAKRNAGLPTDDREALFEYSVALLQGKHAWLGTLDSALRRTQVAREERHAALADMRAKEDSRRRASNEVDETSRDRLRLFRLAGTQFQPVHLKEVTVLFGEGQALRGAESYKAVVTESDEAQESDRKIAFLVEGVIAASEALQVRRSGFLAAERDFAAVSNRWQTAHGRQGDMLRHAYYLQFGLEIFDSAVTVLTSDPAGIVFEAAWRVGESVWQYRSGSARIEEPLPSAAVTAYRDNLAQRLDEAARAGTDSALQSDEQWLENFRRTAANAPFALPSPDHMGDEQLKEITKGAIATGVIDGLKALAAKGIKEKLGREAMTRFLESEMFKERFVVEAVKERLPRFFRGSDAAGALVNSARESWLKGKGKDVLRSAAVTAGKEVVSAAYRQQMAESATEMALLDIEYLLRRYEYIMRGNEYRAFAAKLRDAEAAVGAVMEEAARITQPRRLDLRQNEPISTTDDTVLQLVFTAPVNRVTLVANGRTFAADGDGLRLVEFKFPARQFSAGPVPLAIRATSDRLGSDYNFDANPITVARYDATAAPGATRFIGFENGADERHSLTFADPRMALVQPKTLGYLPGDWLEVAWELPASLARRRTLITIEPGGNPQRADTTAGPKRTARFPAPNETGSHQLQLREVGRAIVHAQVPFTVVPPIRREIGRGPFVRIFEVQLSDRGPPFDPSATPIAAGRGRFVFERRGAAAELVTPRIAIKPAGSAQVTAYSYGSSEIDLPAGNYDAVVEAAVAKNHPGLSLSAGNTVWVRSAGDGRLTLDCRDALGAAITPHVEVRRPGEKDVLVHLFNSRSADLPPGSYDLRIEVTPAIEHRGVTVTGGRETVVVSSGYGRLQLDGVDGVGQPASNGVYIRQSGASVDLTSTYANRYFDLPPGNYDAKYFYTPPIEFKGVSVAAGTVTIVKAEGYGRLRISVVDLRGQKSPARISVCRPSQSQEVSHAYDGEFVDVPSGPYDLVFQVREKDKIVEKRVSAMVATGVESAATVRVP